MKRIVIIGASGHGKVVADIARLNGYDDIVFLDNNPNVKECAGYSVLGDDTLVNELDGDLFVSIGKAEIRKKLMDNYKGRVFPILKHPASVVANGVEIGEGSVVMAGAVINPEAKIGRGCIINTASSVDHDCVVCDFCHVSVGSHLCGTVYIGENSWIGAGAVVSNNISVCDDCMIGAGAVVIKNIEMSGTYVGVPARIIANK